MRIHKRIGCADFVAVHLVNLDIHIKDIRCSTQLYRIIFCPHQKANSVDGKFELWADSNKARPNLFLNTLPDEL